MVKIIADGTRDFLSIPVIGRILELWTNDVQADQLTTAINSPEIFPLNNSNMPPGLASNLTGP